MAEYIKREYAIKTHCNLCRETCVCDGNKACCFEVKAFKRIPAADVVEVKRAIPTRHYQRFLNSDGEIVREVADGWECPICGSTKAENYCPNCGAEMDGDGE